MVEEAETESAVVVAPLMEILPPPTALKIPVIVVEPVTASAEEVALVMLSLPPFTALRIPAIVVEPVTAREPVVVPEVKENASPVMRPLFDIEKRVEVEYVPATLVVEPIAKRVVRVEEARLCREREANGEVDAIPTLLPKYALPVVVAPPEMVRPPACVPSPMVEEASA